DVERLSECSRLVALGAVVIRLDLQARSVFELAGDAREDVLSRGFAIAGRGLFRQRAVGIALQHPGSPGDLPVAAEADLADVPAVPHRVSIRERRRIPIGILPVDAECARLPDARAIARRPAGFA